MHPIDEHLGVLHGAVNKTFRSFDWSWRARLGDSPDEMVNEVYVLIREAHDAGKKPAAMDLRRWVFSRSRYFASDVARRLLGFYRTSIPAAPTATRKKAQKSVWLPRLDTFTDTIDAPRDRRLVGGLQRIDESEREELILCKVA